MQNNYSFMCIRKQFICLYIVISSVFSINAQEIVGEISVISNNQLEFKHIHSLALSGDGKTIAVGYYGVGKERSFGGVLCYKEVNGIWKQAGQELIGSNLGETFGSAVGLSMGGKILVVGSEYGFGENYTDDPDYKPFFQVFEFINGHWSQIGQEFGYGIKGDRTGRDIKVSNDGSRALVSSIWYKKPLTNAKKGRLRVFERTGNSYEQINETIVGPYWDARFIGTEIDFSDDGSVIPVFSLPEVTFTSRDQVYLYIKNNKDEYDVMEFANEDCIESTSTGKMTISDDGNTLLILQCENLLSTYTRDEFGEYNLVSQDEILENDDSYNDACSMRMSDEANHLVLFGLCNAKNTIYSFVNDNNNWKLLNHDYLKVYSDYPRQFAELSDNGKRLAFVQASRIIQDGPSAHIQIYEFNKLDTSISSEEELNQIGVYPNPTSGGLSISGFDLNSAHYRIYNSLGIAIDEGILHSDFISISDLPSGSYLLSINDSIRSLSELIVKF